MGSVVCVLKSLQSCPTLQPYRLQPARLLCPWGFSGQEYWSGLPCSPGKPMVSVTTNQLCGYSVKGAKDTTIMNELTCTAITFYLQKQLVKQIWSSSLLILVFDNNRITEITMLLSIVVATTRIYSFWLKKSFFHPLFYNQQ